MIYLASQSPRRAELLDQIHVRYEKLSIFVSETVLPQELARDYVTRIACKKSTAASETLHKKRLPYFPILSADTIVVLDGRIMGKPAHKKDAQMMLTALSGKTHQVITAVALVHGEHSEHILVESTVNMARLHPKEIDSYIKTKEPFDKAGGYGIQGQGALIIEKISGSYTNIVGLPIRETGQLLARFGIPIWR